MSDLIRDPFDTTQAIMPSGRLGARVFVAPAGTPAPSPIRDGLSAVAGWRLVGWSDGVLGALHTTPKEEQQ